MSVRLQLLCLQRYVLFCMAAESYVKFGPDGKTFGVNHLCEFFFFLNVKLYCTVKSANLKPLKLFVVMQALSSFPVYWSRRF